MSAPVMVYGTVTWPALAGLSVTVNAAAAPSATCTPAVMGSPSALAWARVTAAGSLSATLTSARRPSSRVMVRVMAPAAAPLAKSAWDSGATTRRRFCGAWFKSLSAMGMLTAAVVRPAAMVTAAGGATTRAAAAPLATRGIVTAASLALVKVTVNAAAPPSVAVPVSAAME